ncbi:hypothetical protein J7L05_00750 [bacterium]|nr:hypothetical protein [bacterium]
MIKITPRFSVVLVNSKKTMFSLFFAGRCGRSLIASNKMLQEMIMSLQRKLIKGCDSIFYIILFFIAITAGCSSSGNIEMKTDKISNNNKESITPPEIDHQTSYDHVLIFPISEDPRLLGQHNRASMVGKLRKSITDYRRATGVYPESITEYIDSGFPLFWPRNLMNGLPVIVLANRDVTNDPSDFGSVKWGKEGVYNLLISCNIDLGKDKDSGETTWVINKDGLNDFKGNITPRMTTIVGGTAPINMVSDPETRKLYAQCGQLTDFIFSTTYNYYSENNSLPQSFINDLSYQQLLGMTPFIIKENLDKFAQELANADVEFKIGYDYPNTASYALLKINGETLISHCYKYDYSKYEYSANVNPLVMDEGPGIHVGIYMDEIDMSSPMISDSNLSALNIPDQFLISIEDIPIE